MSITGVDRWWRGVAAGLSSKGKEALAALPACARANMMAARPQRSWWVCSSYWSIILLFPFGLVSSLLSNNDFLLLCPLLALHQFSLLAASWSCQLSFDTKSQAASSIDSWCFSLASPTANKSLFKRKEHS